jgi:chlorobactene glucosyltransferase
VPTWVGLLWGAPVVAVLPLLRRRPNVAAQPVDLDHPVTIVVPARNESATVDTLLASLLRSTHHHFEVVVVDDRSEDDTAQRVAAWGARDSRVRLITGSELPDGWFGKPWACRQGADAATADLLLFTDADTVHAPDLLGHAVGALRATDADLLTLTSRQRCDSFWERVVMPQIWMLLAVRFHPARVSRARRPDQAVANGQFILLHRSAYEAAGGHGAVRGEVVEDLALAQQFVRSGRRMQMMFGEDLLTTRMYRSLSGMVEGWSKNLHVGARQSAGDSAVLRALAPFAMAAGFVFWLIPPLLLAIGVAPDAMRLGVLASLAFWALVLIGMRVPPHYALGYPLGAAMALAIAIRSIWRGQRRIVWRGRSYRVTGDNAQCAPPPSGPGPAS